jgi:hypothetical protein
MASCRVLPLLLPAAAVGGPGRAARAPSTAKQRAASASGQLLQPSEAVLVQALCHLASAPPLPFLVSAGCPDSALGGPSTSLSASAPLSEALALRHPQPEQQQQQCRGPTSPSLSLHKQLLRVSGGSAGSSAGPSSPRAAAASHAAAVGVAGASPAALRAALLPFAHSGTGAQDGQPKSPTQNQGQQPALTGSAFGGGCSSDASTVGAAMVGIHDVGGAPCRVAIAAAVRRLMELALRSHEPPALHVLAMRYLEQEQERRKSEGRSENDDVSHGGARTSCWPAAPSWAASGPWGIGRVSEGGRVWLLCAESVAGYVCLAKWGHTASTAVAHCPAGQPRLYGHTASTCT